MNSINIFIFTSALNSVLAFIAYDCGGSSINITAFGNNDIGSCDLPTPIETININRIQLLQKASIHNIRFKSCFIQLDILITR